MKNGYDKQLLFLKEHLEGEKAFLGYLMEDKTQLIEKSSFSVEKVDDRQQLQLLNNCLQYCFVLGYCVEGVKIEKKRFKAIKISVEILKFHRQRTRK